MDEPAAQDDAIKALLAAPFNEQIAFFRNKLGNLVPTRRWTDMQRGAHDRGFMVAGAQNADLLAGLAAAVDRGIAEGVSLGQFRKDFAALVQRSGWDYTGDFNWRTRTIYATNIATSYNAGRLAQLREGKFPLWVYVHADGVLHPRPLHVSWSGVTLPPDNNWWKTHFTPNGWGCHCRIVGVTSYEQAARYGAVKRVAPDDGIDPKTGAPRGIDKGWDYMPGDTVSDTVRQMAAKTQQWDYVLAKAYMQGVPESVRDALATAYRSLPSVATDTRLYAQRLLEGVGEVPPYRTLGLLTSDQAKRLAAAKIDAAGFDFALDANSVRHVRAKHGDDVVEVARGQRAVTAADYARLPELLSQAELSVTGAAKSTGAQLIHAEAEFDGERFVTEWEFRGKRKMLALKTFYIVGARP